jgi:rhodanese-related sulfurtransferase
MKFLVFCLSILCTVSVSCQTATRSSVKNVTAAEAAKLTSEVKQVQFLDVRTPEECAGGIIKNAQKVSIQNPTFVDAVAQQIDKTKPVVVYCAAGGRSAKASQILAKAGFTQVYNMTEGFGAWKTGGNPVE